MLFAEIIVSEYSEFFKVSVCRQSDQSAEYQTSGKMIAHCNRRGFKCLEFVKILLLYKVPVVQTVHFEFEKLCCVDRKAKFQLVDLSLTNGRTFLAPFIFFPKLSAKSTSENSEESRRIAARLFIFAHFHARNSTFFVFFSFFSLSLSLSFLIRANLIRGVRYVGRPASEKKKKNENFRGENLNPTFCEDPTTCLTHPEP